MTLEVSLVEIENEYPKGAFTQNCAVIQIMVTRPHILHFQKKNSRPVFQYYLLLKTIKLAREMAASSCFVFPSGKLL